MKKILLLSAILMLLQFATISARDVTPRINGKPSLILGGELGNSSASNAEDIDRIFPHLKAIGLNTVLVPAYWDLFEPEEGQFDFTLTDHVLQQARANDLNVVFLWFGAWKNSMSCYTPEWFKRDWRRFPRARTKEGKPLEIASAFSENVYQADSKAFKTWLRHVADADSTGRVVMIQIENEIGMLESARDHSDIANDEYSKWHDIDPQADTLPEIYREERFMAAAYAKYVERLAREARNITDVPLYVNAAMNSRGRTPGQYPSAGPLAHLMDIWKHYAPTVDFMSPDLYDSGYKGWIARYATENNQLFIPEIRRDENNGVKAFYAFGEKDALGFSPFSIEDAPADTRLKLAYGCLDQLTPYILKYRGTEAMSGVLFDQADRDTTIISDGMKLHCSHFFTLPWDSRATDGSRWPEGGGIVIRIAPMEYIIAGSGIVVEFDRPDAAADTRLLGEDGFALVGMDAPESSLTTKAPDSRIGIASCDQVSISPDGNMRYIRRLNGDQDHQGRHVRIGVDDFEILHVRLYEYQ
ncbi:MAG: DUF5597 domain-containing protein [Muribaculaceae bacterium]|nr:DUF5597 domain-containing protein [Muribaculaceae bacterium]